jgi:coenzyme PQQ biosynthesis protein C
VSGAANGEQSTGAFPARLEALAQRHYQHRHPFNALLHAGRLGREELRLWFANRYHYLTRVPITDALIVAKADDPAFRRLWVQRLLDHDGWCDPRRADAVAAAPGEIERWRQLGKALGVTEVELATSARLLPEVRVLCDEYVESVRDADLVTAVAGTLTDYFASRSSPLPIELWLRRYPFVEESALARFGRGLAQPAGDAEFALGFVQRHATTAELERRCLDAFVTQCVIQWRLLDAVYLACRRGQFPRIESRAWLMRLSALAEEDERGRSSAPAVLMLPERSLQLNRTAYDLLERCDGKHTLDCIVQELGERHAAPPGLIERDIATFVAELERRSAVSFQGHPSSGAGEARAT